MCVVPFRAWPWLLLLLVAACSVQHTPVPVPEGVDARFTIEQGNSPAEAPPDASIRAITPLEVATSLRRVTVRVSTWVSLVYGEPEPLFSEEQVVQFSPIIADTLHTMPEDGVLRLAFQDRFKHRSVDVWIYGEGPELVYYFNALVRDTETLRPPNDGQVDGAKLEALAGQTVTRGDAQVLRHPVRGASLARLEARDAAMARIKQAREEERINAAEQTRLEAVASGPDAPAPEVWDTFWQRWDLLDKAHRQGLIDKESYEQRKAEMIGQLTR
jgi:hypothetical protein